MPKTIWVAGDCFTFDAEGRQGRGTVISHNRAVLVTRGDGRGGWNVTQGNMPKDAVSASIIRFPSEVQMALRGARAAVGLS